LEAKSVYNLVANLKDAWIIDISKSEKVRLVSEGESAYSWSEPAVYSLDRSWDTSSRWRRTFALYGNGPNRSSILSPTAWAEIDIQLRRSEHPKFVSKDFDALCAKLGLAARRTNLQAWFRLSAELPARFVSVQTNPTTGTLEVDIECLRSPDLMIDWLPQHEFQTVSQEWQRGPEPGLRHVSVPLHERAEKAEVMLSFADIEAADIVTHDIVRKEPSVPSSPQEKAPSSEYGRWKMKRSLPEGGQAHIFLVEDTTREFAGQWVLKRLKNIDDPERRKRFEQEVEAVRSINHPNVLKVIDSDLAAERPYFVAEFCEGGSLQSNGASRYRGNILATTDVVLPILDALVAAHAHEPHIFHRDVKPANILIRKDGTPVIGDFGICYMEKGEPVTLSNEGMGSRNFIAPEMESGQRHLGEPSDRTDVYSLGKVIYWMLSGGKEFAREDYPSLVDLLRDQRFEHVHRLLEQMVVRHPAKRIRSHEVKEKLEITASLVEGGFAPLAPSSGIRCRFCGLGKYERFAVYDYRDPSKSRQHPDGTSQLGFYPVSPGTNIRALRCSHCGHVEWFQVTDIKDPNWWDR
jgi:hypothetical protein